jgi:hypothetical protein
VSQASASVQEGPASNWVSRDALEDVRLAVRVAPISRDADWLPAIEQFGEGIYVHFDEVAIGRWLANAVRPISMTPSQASR